LADDAGDFKKRVDESLAKRKGSTAAELGKADTKKFGVRIGLRHLQTRFYIDPATGLPHIYGHQVDEDEAMEVLEKPGEDRAGREAPGSHWARPPRAGIRERDLTHAGCVRDHKLTSRLEKEARANIGASISFTWSPDSQWIAFERSEGGKTHLVKMKPVAGATAIPLTSAAPDGDISSEIQWSPKGDWIAYPSAEGISMVSPDGGTVRKLTERKLMVFAFSRDGSQVYGVFCNTTGEGAEWQLYTIDVKTGAEKMLAPIDLPASADTMVGFSLHPDGKRFLTSIGKWPWDIWMLEGWNQPQKTWLDRLLRR
jgi:hypothetical protein